VSTFLEAKEAFDNGLGLGAILPTALVPVHGQITSAIAIRNRGICEFLVALERWGSGGGAEGLLQPSCLIFTDFDLRCLCARDQGHVFSPDTQ
jgi:hypothetical protein